MPKTIFFRAKTKQTVSIDNDIYMIIYNNDVEIKFTYKEMMELLEIINDNK